MASIENMWVRLDGTHKPGYGKGMQYRVVWHDDAGRQSKSFRNKTAAKRHKTFVEHQQYAGEYTPQEVRERTLGDYWPRLEAMKRHRAPKTREQAANSWRHIEAQFDGRRISTIRADEISAWIEGVESSRGVRMSHSGRVKLRQALTALLDMAVEDGVIPANPARKVSVQSDPERPHIFLDAGQARSLVDNTDEHYRGLVVFMLNTGLRLGEALEVRVGDFDLGAGRLTVARTYSGGRVSHTKGRRTRVVPLPSVLVDDLTERLRGRKSGDLVFTGPKGGRIEPSNFRKRVFYPAVAASTAPDGTHPHTLRHTYASAAASSGVPPKVLQSILGHADIRTTLDVYAGTYGADLDGAAATVAGFYG